MHTYTCQAIDRSRAAPENTQGTYQSPRNFSVWQGFIATRSAWQPGLPGAVAMSCTARLASRC